LTEKHLCAKLATTRWEAERAPVSEELATENVQRGLLTRILGQRIVYYTCIDSTNRAGKALAQQGAAEGTLIIADEQTAGRGRLERPWLAPRGTSLLFSLVLRPHLEVRLAQGLTMIAGLAVQEAIRDVCGLPARLKWPNDIMLHGRKAGGILTEMSSTGHRLDYVVVGIGLNVNLPLHSLPPEFQATCIQHELGRPVPRLPLLQHILAHLERRYAALQRGRWPVQEWAAALETLGQRVELRTAGQPVRGLALRVDEDGALLVHLDNGETQRVLVGDIVPQHTAKRRAQEDGLLRCS